MKTSEEIKKATLSISRKLIPLMNEDELIEANLAFAKTIKRLHEEGKIKED